MQSMGEYSEFTMEELGLKTSSDTAHAVVGAVGSAEETLNSKTVTKKYKGVEVKTRTKGDGTGELKLSMHMNYAKYKEIYGMKLDSLIDGVAAYGQNSTHKEFSLTALVLDEDDVKKLKAYPNCIIKDGVSRKIENGSEEVAEIEMTVALMPDDYKNCMYEALYEDVDETVAGTWMTAFTPELVQAAEA